MWLFECLADDFQNKRLWLRPGKTYLFGRTVSEPGQIAISHKTISRKHLTITVDPVQNGDAFDPARRSRVTVEDLGTKIGTSVDGRTIRGEKSIVTGDLTIFKLAHYAVEFRLLWRPVVFSFSFGSKELQGDPMTKLRAEFEQLDVKLLTQYSVQHTTHVVSKKRNTSKGLQALINGTFIVAGSFLDALAVAAGRDCRGDETGPLENDFDGAWPRELDHLPTRGNEATDRPAAEYGPDPDRRDIFEQYTFIFYDQAQFDNLLPPITNGKGKALYHHVVPGETTVDEFVLHVQEVAGLTSPADGADGRSVVLVRYTPVNGGKLAGWYGQFFTAVSLRLDHRPIEQSEFLDAILAKQPALLRRPLEIEEAPPADARAPAPETAPPPPTPRPNPDRDPGETPAATVTTSPPRRGRRLGRPVKKRFAGFDDEVDMEEDPDPDPLATAKDPVLTASYQPSQQQQQQQQQPTLSERPTRLALSEQPTQRKRTASPLDEPEEALMDGIIPMAAARKRQRIAAGEDASTTRRRSREPTPLPASESDRTPTKKQVKQVIDIIELARRNRAKEDAAHIREAREDLALMSEGVDFEAIRRLAIVEEIQVRVPGDTGKTGETQEQEQEQEQAQAHEQAQEQEQEQQRQQQNVVGGRWDPRWNGRKNFKRFQCRGKPRTQTPMRDIIPLAEIVQDETSIHHGSGRRGRGRETRALDSPDTTMQDQSLNQGQDQDQDHNQDQVDQDHDQDSDQGRTVVVADTPPVLPTPPSPPGHPSPALQPERKPGARQVVIPESGDEGGEDEGGRENIVDDDIVRETPPGPLPGSAPEPEPEQQPPGSHTRLTRSTRAREVSQVQSQSQSQPQYQSQSQATGGGRSLSTRSGTKRPAPAPAREQQQPAKRTRATRAGRAAAPMAPPMAPPSRDLTGDFTGANDEDGEDGDSEDDFKFTARKGH